MNSFALFVLFLVGLGLFIKTSVWLRARILLSKAKHPSLRGHSKISKKIARLIPHYDFDSHRFFASDSAPESIQHQRQAAFQRLATVFEQRYTQSARVEKRLLDAVSDLQFVHRYRVPFQFSRYLRERLHLSLLVKESSGVTLTDIDGNKAYDLMGSYGVNVLGNDFYKSCIDAGIEKVRQLGPVLGPYHPLIEDNVHRLRELSGLDEISFHMSGTEAVMQAVRLALYHTGRSHVVRFCGAYHGWWDGVQPGIGNPRRVNDVYTLKDLDDDTLRVLRQRHDIACVLVNPLQALHPNANPPGDGMLVNSERASALNRQAYTEWLHKLREVCSERGIVFILDDIFTGFRIAYRGAQEYFNIQADLLTYGKTLGGGLPVGVVCGKHRLMRRFREDRPTDICFARGTFNSHPYIMATMNEFLHRIEQPEIQQLYQQLDTTWSHRADYMNAQLAEAGLPVRVANLSSIFTVLYTQPSRYNWMLQFYLRVEGLVLGWIGTGRLIFSLNYSDNDFAEVVTRFVKAARTMQEEGWWWQDEGLTNRSIKRQILKELLSSRINRGKQPLENPST